MKAIKTKSLMSLIYVALLSIPLVSIVSKCIYVQSNKNAYQSYSGNNTTEQYESFSYNELEYGKEYDLVTANQTTTGTLTIYGDYISYLKTNNENVDLDGYSSLYISNNNLIFQGNGQTNKYETYDSVVKITFNYVSYSASSTFTGLDDAFKSLVINEQSKLDNVFEYSVSQIVDENNFGELNFFEWFSSWLLNDSQNNNLYVHFANWYLNYAMLISLMQILFLCLMWFVNFSRKLLDRGMNYDW